MVSKCNNRSSLLWFTKYRPFIVNNLLFIVLELGTGFVSDYNSFLAVRALFGIAMGKSLYKSFSQSVLI